MARQSARQYVDADQEPATEKGRNPDFVVLLRQQPVWKDGKWVRSDNMSVVGAAWKREKLDDKTGEMIEYIGIKAHIKFEVGPEGLLLRAWRERDGQQI